MAKVPASKITIPSSKVDIALAAGNTAAAMKAAGATNGKLFLVPVDKIKPIPGFNVRVDGAGYQARIATLASMIAANGFNDAKPLAGYVAKEGEENVIYVTDGYTRLAAVQKLLADKESDFTIDKLPVIVSTNAPSLTDLTVNLHTANSGSPLSPFELGVVVKRLLREEGADKAAIAGRLGVTPRYLDDVLLLVNSPKEVRTAVLNEQVSSTMAIQELRKAGDEPKKAVERITAAVEKATASGKTKATAKDVGVKMQKLRGSVSVGTGTSMKDIVKAVAALVRQHVQASGEGDEKAASVDGTINLVIEVPAPVVEKPAAKKPATKKADAKKAETTAKLKAEVASDDKAKPARRKKATAATPAPAPEPETEEQDEIVEPDDVTAEGLDDEPAILPPAVKNGEGVEGAEEVDI